MIEPPKLQYLLTCDAIVASPDGKQTLYGLFDRIHAGAFPCAVAQMAVAWGIRTSVPRDVRLQLVSCAGDVLMASDAIHVEGSESLTRGQYVLQSVQFTSPGRYWFRVVVDGDALGDVPVDVEHIGGRAPNEPE